MDTNPALVSLRRKPGRRIKIGLSNGPPDCARIRALSLRTTGNEKPMYTLWSTWTAANFAQRCVAQEIGEDGMRPRQV